VDPDCGLKTRSVEEAIEKMRTLVKVAHALRN
jgi:methionine synthase II (cobalamin-independent)